MKLTKNKLVKLLMPGLEGQGFRIFKDTITGAQGLFIKKLDNGLYLSLGLTISRYDEQYFTGTFYLSPTTTWSAVWGDIPRESYERISVFLSPEEHCRLLGTADEVRLDGWWKADLAREIDNFILAAELAATKLLGDRTLYAKISKSEEINKMVALAKSVSAKVFQEDVDIANLKFQPKKTVDDIPYAWFYAAELVLTEKGETVNENEVKFLAADAFRQGQFK